MFKIIVVFVALEFLACCLPAYSQQIQLLSPVSASAKSGTTMTFKIQRVDRGVGKLPSWIPKFHKGQKVRFKIGKSGQLIIPSKGISIDLDVNGDILNLYSWQSVNNGAAGVISKEIQGGFRKKDTYPYKRGIVLYFKHTVYAYNNGPVTSRSVTYFFE